MSKAKQDFKNKQIAFGYKDILDMYKKTIKFYKVNTGRIEIINESQQV